MRWYGSAPWAGPPRRGQPGNYPIGLVTIPSVGHSVVFKDVVAWSQIAEGEDSPSCAGDLRERQADPGIASLRQDLNIVPVRWSGPRLRFSCARAVTAVRRGLPVGLLISPQSRRRWRCPRGEGGRRRGGGASCWAPEAVGARGHVRGRGKSTGGVTVPGHGRSEAGGPGPFQHSGVLRGGEGRGGPRGAGLRPSRRGSRKKAQCLVSARWRFGVAEPAELSTLRSRGGGTSVPDGVVCASRCDQCAA